MKCISCCINHLQHTPLYLTHSFILTPAVKQHIMWALLESIMIINTSTSVTLHCTGMLLSPEQVDNANISERFNVCFLSTLFCLHNKTFMAFCWGHFIKFSVFILLLKLCVCTVDARHTFTYYGWIWFLSYLWPWTLQL